MRMPQVSSPPKIRGDSELRLGWDREHPRELFGESAVAANCQASVPLGSAQGHAAERD
jgi:hypothetical protein